MSLQIQSSQQPPSSGGRRTPQVYQNLATAGGGSAAAAPTPGVNPAPTNGNSGKASKLSLKASAKQNASVAAPAPQPQPDVIIIDPVLPKEILKGAGTASSNVVVSVAKLPAGTNGNSTNGKHDEAAKPAAPTTPKKDEEVKEKKVKSSPRATPQKQQQQQQESIPVEHIKTPESAGKKGAAASKDTTPTVVTPENKKKTASAADNSLAAEKTLKGFTAEGDEMESLMVEPTEYEDSPMPPRTGGKSKLLKYAGAPPTRARISPFRVNSANAAAVAAAATATANLSTVSEGQTTESNEASPAIPPADFNRPLRAISGRRSTRPLTDIQFTYRKSTDLNDSSSSLNVTVGSEIHNDSLRTPGGLAGSSRKRKNMTPESTSDALDVQEHTDSPKRTRLDFSGFLGIVASPVTMLKNRFSRVRLATSSTPVAKRNYDEEDLATCVTAEATTTTANISGGQAAGSSEAKMDVEPAETPVETEAKKDGEESTTTTPKDGQTDLPAEGDASVAEEAQEESVEVKDITDKQRRCVIM